MSDIQSSAVRASAGPAWRRGLWIAQLVLSVFFGAVGSLNFFLSPIALTAMGLNYATEIPLSLLRFIGVSQLAGAAGLILPALTRIMPRLTPLAALGLATIQILSIAFHLVRGELAEMTPMIVLPVAWSLFVFWGRTWKAPIAPR